jgi:cell division protein FtsQ
MVKKRVNRRKVKFSERLKGLGPQIRAAASVWAPRVGLLGIAVAIPYVSYLAYDHTLSGPYFQVKSIEVSGVTRMDDETILEVGKLQEGMNIFDVNVEQAEVELKTLPWVKGATVNRELPDVLVVNIEEHVPSAVLVDNGYALISRDGVVFKEIEPEDGIDDLLLLPIITGMNRAELESQSGQERYAEAMAALQAYAAKGLAERNPLSEIHIDPVMGLSLVTREHGTEVRLGSGRLDERIERLDVVFRALAEDTEVADYVLVDHESDLGRVVVGRRTWASTDASPVNR